MFKPTIGLEIHAELKTKSKMFCSDLNDARETVPNKNICPVCTAQPGTLPVINEEAVKMVVKAGLALNCQIAEFSKFDRKNYFYPDLPKGYQISQFDMPLCEKGWLNLGEKKINIRRIHLEEDTGRLLHEGKDFSLVDYNRAGVPLMELVTEPDLESGKEVREFSQELQMIFRYLGISEADMEKGQMRIEVNISLAQEGEALGTKVEIKNLNSFRIAEKAVDFEIKRQKEILESGGKIIQETRGWHDLKEITFSQREKEESHDYRYFPEPDLPGLRLSANFLKEISSQIPELPGARRKRMISEYGILAKEAEILTQMKDLGEYFEKAVSEFEANLAPEKLAKLTRLAVNYLISDILGSLGGASFDEKSFKVSPENFAEFVLMVEGGSLSSKMAKILLPEMVLTGKDPSEIITEKDLVKISGSGEVETFVREAIQKNPQAVEDFKKGKENSFQFLIGQVMALSKGKVDPDVARQKMKEMLTSL